MGKKAKNKKPSKRNKRKNIRLKIKRIVIFVAIVIALTIITMICIFLNRPHEAEKPILPVMRIVLNDVTLEEINENSKEIKYPNNLMSIETSNGIYTFLEVELKGRGNYSWKADKKSYRLKFNKKVNLLNLGKKRKWVLVSNDIDDSFLRNDLAYYLSGLIGSKYVPKGEFVKLIIDENDLGLYYLTKTIEIDKQAVDLKEPEGILVEIDNAYCDAEEKWYRLRPGDCMVFKDVVAEDYIDIASEDFLDDYKKLLNAIEKKDYGLAWQYADLESFARYFVLSEFTANPDAFITSWYLYKDGPDDKIHSDLFWDFDGAFGNRRWGWWSEELYSPTTNLARFKYTFEPSETKVCGVNKKIIVESTVDISWTMCDLLEMPEFRSLVEEIYLRDLSTRRNEVMDYINKRRLEIEEVAEEDVKMWEKEDFNAEVNYLLDWVEKRFNYFDENYGEKIIDAKDITRQL